MAQVKEKVVTDIDESYIQRLEAKIEEQRAHIEKLEAKESDVITVRTLRNGKSSPFTVEQIIAWAKEVWSTSDDSGLIGTKPPRTLEEAKDCLIIAELATFEDMPPNLPTLITKQGDYLNETRQIEYNRSIVEATRWAKELVKYAEEDKRSLWRLRTILLEGLRHE